MCNNCYNCYNCYNIKQEDTDKEKLPVFVISRFLWRTSVALALTFSLVSACTSTPHNFTPTPTTHNFTPTLPPVTLTQISSDPYTNKTSQHKTEVEPGTFGFGNTIVAAFKAGRFFKGGASNIGWATSINGGQTWTHGFLPGTTVYAGGPYDQVSDPSVAYDAMHNVWMISYLAHKTSSSTGALTDVLASHSTDGGVTWSAPVLVKQGGPMSAFDKDWIVCDDTTTSPFYGHCYTEFDEGCCIDLVLLSTSTDGGKTWGRPMTTADRASGLGGQPLVQPNGTVIVPIIVFTSSLTIENIAAFQSTNGGESWSSTILISRPSYHHPKGGMRAPFPFPSAAIDRSGNVYVAWPDCRFESGCSTNDFVLSASSDGRTWLAVRRIPIDPVGSGVDHFLPGLAVDPSTSGITGHLVLAFYYYPNANCISSTCQLEVGSSSSTDGGSTWSSTNHLAGPMTLSWLASTSQGAMVGDYISTSFSAGKAYPVFAVATAPGGGVFNEAMFTVSGGLT
jgi:BNR repeat-like domain